MAVHTKNKSVIIISETVYCQIPKQQLVHHPFLGLALALAVAMVRRRYLFRIDRLVS